jgi:SAM-dependent methyltransferase
MLAEFRKTSTEVPIVLGDAHRLPIADGSVDLSVFVVTLEFLEDPQLALVEAMRVARRGVLLITLNPWSLGGLSRKIGAQSRGAILSRAKRFPIGSLRAMAAKAAGSRLQRILWTSTLFPDGLWRICFPIPLGNVLGLALLLAP